MKNSVFILGVACLFFACGNEKKESNLEVKKYDKIEQLQWLIGNWTNNLELEKSYENWIQVNDSTLSCHSFTLLGTDTIFAEKVTLKQIGTEAHFTVVAYQQNDDQPVTFKLVSPKDGVFTFENPKHDFPRSISYSNPVKDSIHAWIAGTVNGEARKVDFLFKRVD